MCMHACLHTLKDKNTLGSMYIYGFSLRSFFQLGNFLFHDADQSINFNLITDYESLNK